MAMMAVTGAAIVFCTLPASRAGFNFSLAAFDLTKTMRIGHMLAEVGPILGQVVNLLQQGVVDRPVQPHVVGPRLAEEKIQIVVAHVIAPCTC